MRGGRSWAVVALGLAVAVGLLALLVSLVGVADVLAAVAAADRTVLAGMVIVAFVWMLAWSYSLHLVLGTLGVDVPVTRSFFVYTNVLFVNVVAPFSVLGAEPVAALLVARSTDASYERSFAAVVSVDVLNFLPAPALVVAGLFPFAVGAVLGDAVEAVVLSLLGVFVVLTVGGYLGWRGRHGLARRVPRALVGVERRIGRYVPGVRFPSADAVERRVASGLEGLERVAADRRTLSLGLAASTAGWTLLSAMLWLALDAVGHAVPVTVPLFVVPLATVTDVVPVPGGVGSVDAALVVLLVATAGVPPASATAATLLFRSASVLLPVAVGGVTTVVVQSR